MVPVFLTLIGALALLPNQGHGLRCFECVDMRVKGYRGSDIDMQSNPVCTAGSITSIDTLNSRSCPDGSVCAASSGTGTAKDRYGNYVSFGMVARSCGKTSAAMGCTWGSNGAEGMLPSGGGLVDVKFEGHLCYCNQDYCSPISCPDGYTKLAGYCMEWWVLASLVAMLFVTVALVTCCFGCCCCCCFRPCKSSGKTAGTVIHREPVAFDNQLYVVMSGHPNVVCTELDTKPSKN